MSLRTVHRSGLAALLLAALAAGPGAAAVAPVATAATPVSPATPASPASPATPASPVSPASPASQTLYGVGAGGIRWSIPIPLGGGGQSAPLVDGGVAYLAAPLSTMAVRTGDGAVLWNTPTADAGYGRFLDGTSFVVEGFHHVTAYARSTGQRLWSFVTNENILGVPVRTGGDGLAFGTGNGRTFVLNLSNGKLRWSAKATGQDLVVADSLTVLRSDPSYLQAYDARTGKRLWRKTFSPTNPVVTQGVLVDRDQASMTVSGFDLRSGRLLWAHSRSGFTIPVAGLNGRVLIQPRGELALVDARTGKQFWRVRSGVVNYEQFQAAVSSGILAVIGGTQANGRSLRSGRLVWSAPLPIASSDGSVDPVTTSPNYLATVVDGRGGGLVTDFSTVTGAPAWSVTLPQQPIGAAHVDGTDTVGANAVVLTEPEQMATAA